MHQDLGGPGALPVPLDAVHQLFEEGRIGRFPPGQIQADGGQRGRGQRDPQPPTQPGPAPGANGGGGQQRHRRVEHQRITRLFGGQPGQEGQPAEQQKQRRAATGGPPHGRVGQGSQGRQRQRDTRSGGGDQAGIEHQLRQPGDTSGFGGHVARQGAHVRAGHQPEHEGHRRQHAGPQQSREPPDPGAAAVPRSQRCLAEGDGHDHGRDQGEGPAGQPGRGRRGGEHRQPGQPCAPPGAGQRGKHHRDQTGQALIQVDPGRRLAKSRVGRQHPRRRQPIPPITPGRAGHEDPHQRQQGKGQGQPQYGRIGDPGDAKDPGQRVHQQRRIVAGAQSVAVRAQVHQGCGPPLVDDVQGADHVGRLDHVRDAMEDRVFGQHGRGEAGEQQRQQQERAAARLPLGGDVVHGGGRGLETRASVL